MNADKKELIAGAVAFLAAAVVFCAVAAVGKGRSSGTYTLSARFNQTEGLIAGNDVRLAGIKVGRVESLRLDDYYGVIATLSLPESIRLPDDSGAAVQSSGLIGAKYVELTPGGSEDMLENGGFIEFTQDSPDLMGLLDKVIDMAKADRKTATKQEVKP